MLDRVRVLKKVLKKIAKAGFLDEVSSIRINSECIDLTVSGDHMGDSYDISVYGHGERAYMIDDDDEDEDEDDCEDRLKRRTKVLKIVRGIV